MQSAPDPQPLGQAISRLIATRGLAQVHGREQLRATWRDVAGESIASKTEALKIDRGALVVNVHSAALMSELVSFHRDRLLRDLQRRYADLKIRSIKFQLRSRDVS